MSQSIKARDDSRSSLHERMLEAHHGNNLPALVSLYTQAADEAEARDEIDAACFFLTHAHIFALEAGHATRVALHERLIRHGRDLPDS